VISIAPRTPARAAAALPQLDLLDLVGDIYQAGLEPERWPTVLGRISQAFEADLACIYTPAPAFPEQALYLTHNFSDSTQAHYAAYYHQHDAWTGAANQRDIYIQGLVAFGEELIPQAQLHRTEFYNDFLKPNGLEWIVTTALFDGRADPHASAIHTPATHMTFTRHRDHAAFQAEQARLIHQIAPHVRRALLTHWRLTEAWQRAQTHQDALERLGYGLILLDDTGKPLHHTPLAERLLQQGHGLTLRAGRLRAPHPEDQNALERLIQQALLGLGGGLQLRAGQSAPNTPADSAPLRLSALPIKPGQTLPHSLPTSPFQRPGALLLIQAPQEKHPPTADLQAFATRHHLTPAELRVLQSLLNDHAPKQIASEQGVSIKTVRTQLSSLFTKTGTRNQRELVKAALASVI
jgi:DNA-binding CsgD family transcriptional regulator/PAS domain-containing protein